MKKIFEKKEIKEGFLIRCMDNCTKEFFNMTIMSVKLDPAGVRLQEIVAGYPVEPCDTLACICPGEKGHYFPLSRFTDDLVHVKGYYTIQSIYGRTAPAFAMDNSTKHRERLWIREEPKKMTLDDIKKALGYDIEII